MCGLHPQFSRLVLFACVEALWHSTLSTTAKLGGEGLNLAVTGDAGFIDAKLWDGNDLGICQGMGVWVFRWILFYITYVWYLFDRGSILWYGKILCVLEGTNHDIRQSVAGILL